MIDKSKFAVEGEQPSTIETDSLLDEESLVRLREFFAILDQWDRQEVKS